tara:strand:- start:958 stop:1935 length:978 start_codon:yes stop_codon:yes gene_type:complete
MKLLDILNEGTEYLVKYTVLKDKDFSRGTASYKDEADAKKFFTDLQKDNEVISATLRKKVGPDSSMDTMGGMAKHLGSEYDLDRYTHPAYYKKGELEGQDKNIRYFLSTPSFLSKKRGFTNNDGSDRFFEENLKEGLAKSAIMRQIKDAEEILDSGEADGMPLDNETEMLVQQELARLKRMLAMNEADLTKGEERKLKKMSKDLKKSSKSHASQAKYIDKIVKEDTSLEELYSQVQESRYGFFSNSEGKTAAGIMTEALDEYEAAVERAFQKLVNKTTTAISIDKSGGLDTEVRDNLTYQFDKIQEKITTGDYLNATFFKVYKMK